MNQLNTVTKITWALSAINSSLFAKESKDVSNELRTALPHVKSVTDVDPHSITNSYESVIASTLYSSLLERELDNGTLVSGLAKIFYWDRDELVLELRTDFHTRDGFSIDTEDVLLSLKRLILINKKSESPVRSRLDNLLCPGGVKTLDSVCRNVKLVDKATIRFKFPKSRPEFVEALSGKPLRILHKKSFDHTTLKISDFGNTTGAYSFTGSKGGFDVLMANESHWQFNKKIPNKILLTLESKGRDSPNSAQSLFLENKIDLITKLSALTPEDYKETQQKVKGSDLFRTNELGLTMLVFTNRGLSLPVETRREISKAILQALRKNSQNLHSFRSISNQFMIPGGFGSLSHDQLLMIEKSISEKVNFKKIPKIKFAISPNIRGSYISRFFKDLSNVFEYTDISDFREVENKPADDTNQPHLYFSSNDVEFYESFHFVSFLLDRGIFCVRGEKARHWLDSYMEEGEKGKREKMLRDLAFDSVLGNPSFIPLFTKPFFSLTRNGWNMKFSPHSTHMPFNRITKE